jgi:hypothetical protein
MPSSSDDFTLARITSDANDRKTTILNRTVRYHKSHCAKRFKYSGTHLYTINIHLRNALFLHPLPLDQIHKYTTLRRGELCWHTFC